MVRLHEFREDLWFRLNVFPIHIPPLRDRREDIPLLIWTFVKQFEKQMGKQIDHIPRKNMEALLRYPWPGNARELKNVIERAMILHRDNPLRFDDLVLSSVKPGKAATGVAADETLELDALIKDHIQRVLQLTGGKIHGPGGAGEVLGVNPGTLRSRMKKLGIPFREKRSKGKKSKSAR